MPLLTKIAQFGDQSTSYAEAKYSNLIPGTEDPN